MDNPCCFLLCFGLVAEIIDVVDAPNLGLRYESYHAQMITGDAVTAFWEMRALIRHIQIGDAPARRAPGKGTRISRPFC